MRPLESGALAADSQAVEFGGAFGRTAASRQKAECRVKCVQLIGRNPVPSELQAASALARRLA